MYCWHFRFVFICLAHGNGVPNLRDVFPAVCIYDLKLALMNSPGSQGENGIDESKVAAIVVGPMLGTNIVSTLLIAWKAWYVSITNSSLLPSGLLTTASKGSTAKRSALT